MAARMALPLGRPGRRLANAVVKDLSIFHGSLSLASRHGTHRERHEQDEVATCDRGSPSGHKFPPQSVFSGPPSGDRSGRGPILAD